MSRAQKKGPGAALITGSGKRIGKAIALALGERGYRVAVHYHHSRDDAQSVVDTIRKQGGEADLFQADLGDAESVAGLIPAVSDRFPDLSLLVNNASVFEQATLCETDHALLQQHLNINLTAPAILMRDFARLEKPGAIVNILDSKITGNRYRYTAYTLSKQALAHLTSMAARELAPTVRVNGIAPGFILLPAAADEQYAARLLQHIPLGRQGSVQDIVRALLYLEDNSYLTGQILYIDGGSHL